jgi:hypothetical protein
MRRLFRVGKTANDAPLTGQKTTEGTPSPITQRNIHDAVREAAIHACIAFLISMTTFLISTQVDYGRSTPRGFAVMNLISASIYPYLGGLIFPFLYGWRRRDWRQGVLLSGTLFAAFSVVTIAIILLVNSTSMRKLSFGPDPSPYLVLAVVYATPGLLGGLLGRWWHNVRSRRNRNP